MNAQDIDAAEHERQALILELENRTAARLQSADSIGASDAAILGRRYALRCIDALTTEQLLLKAKARSERTKG